MFSVEVLVASDFLILLLLAGRLNHPFSCSLGLWENISAGELVRWSSTREEIMVLVVHKGRNHGPCLQETGT